MSGSRAERRAVLREARVNALCAPYERVCLAGPTWAVLPDGRYGALCIYCYRELEQFPGPPEHHEPLCSELGAS